MACETSAVRTHVRSCVANASSLGAEESIGSAAEAGGAGRIGAGEASVVANDRVAIAVDIHGVVVVADTNAVLERPVRSA